MRTLRAVERDRCAPEDFYSTTNHQTHVRNGQQWIEVENQRMDAMIVVARRPRVLPPPARPARGRPDRGGAARHPRDAGIEGARPAVVRLHVQRHLFGAAGGDGGAADRGAGAPRRRAEAEGAGGGRSGGGAYRRRGGPGGADPRRLGARRAQRQRAGRARCGGGAVRHLAGRAPGRRPAGGARPPQSHARHQRDLPRRRRCAQAVESGRLHSGHSLRVREGATSRSCWPAACATTVRCPTPSPT